MLLNESKIVRLACPPVRIETAYQVGPTGEKRETRFRFISHHTSAPRGTMHAEERRHLFPPVAASMGHWEPLAAVTDEYKLLDMRDYVRELDKQAPCAYEPWGARYDGVGRARLVLKRNGVQYKIGRGGPNDGGTTLFPVIALDADYRGCALHRTTHGAVAYVCGNLLLHGGTTETVSIPHRNWNTVPEVAEQVAAVLEKQKEQTEIVRARFGQYAEAVLDAALTAELVAETPKRVQPEFQGAIARYAQTQGRTTAWAVVQAAAEVVEHAWKRAGETPWSASDWLESIAGRVDAALELVPIRKMGA